MAYVLGLGAAEELAEVGAKARNLGILLRAGFPVPPGFCVTTAGYRKAVGSRLTDLFAELVAAADDQTGSIDWPVWHANSSPPRQFRPIWLK